MYTHVAWNVGTAANSLKAFHFHKQKMALEKFEKGLSNNDNAYVTRKSICTNVHAVVQKYFPNGILDKRDLAKLQT